jgi:FAD/FMN-containing dehydrogenase
MPDALETHREKVAAIAAVLRRSSAGRGRVHVTKSGPSHVVPLPADPRLRGTKPVDVSALREVLAIDAESRTCSAEPGISFAELIPRTLEYGLLPTVVPELKGITLGGAVAGCSIESMSFRYGGFHDSCVEYELLTGTGETLTCSPNEEPFLFEMIHGSYGTLAILTRLTFRLVPAEPFVRMEYHRADSFEQFHTELLAQCRSGGFDFIDGIIHGPNHFALCLGRFAASSPYTSDYSGGPIFYRSTRERTEDYLRTADYCFRYDADCHWLTRTVPPLEWRPVRRLLGTWVLGSTNLIRWSKRLEPILRLKRRPDVVCDVFIPGRRFAEFYRWYEREFAFYPLWIVPYRAPHPYPWLAPAMAANLAEDLVIDCAVYGKPNGHPTIDYSQLLEEKTFEFGGIKTLISRNHYSRERFWHIYHQENYRAAKARLDPQGAFPDLFEKLHRV